MSEFKAFMVADTDDEIVEYVASKRYIGEDGKPQAWKLKSISSDLEELLRKECTKKVPLGKRGQQTPELDTDKYIVKVCVASTVFPDLANAELQDFHKVKCGEDLLKALLKPGELSEYKAKVMEVNGYDTAFEDLVDEAKN